MPIDIESLKLKIIPIVAGQKDVTVYLFGSYAKGTANANSDVDLLVVAAQQQAAGRLVRNLYKQLSDVPIDYDILGYSFSQMKDKKIQSQFFNKVLSEGILLYGNRI